MTQKLEAQGTKAGNSIAWDDGSDHDDVTRIIVGGSSSNIQYIWVDYLKGENLKQGSRVGKWAPGFSQTYEINHLNGEQLESVEGYYSSSYIYGIQLKTNLRKFELIGYANYSHTKFSLSVAGKKIIGFHGSTNDGSLNTLGAYLTWIVPTKSDAMGGNAGKVWDDGFEHNGVTKAYVVGGRKGIQYIKFDYLKNGEHLSGSDHGDDNDGGFVDPFEINNASNEYLKSVEGYYESEIIQGLEFKTNFNSSGPMGYKDGKKFKLAANGKQIIGFHGYAENNLNSLGAYFTPIPSIKVDCIGYTSYNNLWDDGTFDGIRKVSVMCDANYCYGITVSYDDGGKLKRSQHGSSTQGVTEFEVDYPNEFITSVEGTLSTYASYGIQTLTFKTSNGRTSPTIGTAATNSSKFVLESKGCGIVGFHGYEPTSFTGWNLLALGAYFRPLSPPKEEKDEGSNPQPTPDVEKIKAKGGDGGDPWDDGCFNGVKKIYIGLNENDIAFIKFLYYKGACTVFGDDHGSKTTDLGVKEFELSYPTEYITSVEGSYDDKSGAMTMLRFKTNTQTSPDYGLSTTTNSNFILNKDGHMIVGFHGESSNMLLYKIGVYVKPITP